MKNQLKPIAYSLMTLSACMPLGLYAAEPAPPSPFYDKPLHLAGGFESKAKPNIMLYIDNSGSMQNYKDVIDTDGQKITRIKAVQNALEALLDPKKNPKIDKNNWGVSYMNHSWGNSGIIATDVQTAKYDENHRQRLLASIKNARALGASPGGAGYSRITKNMINNIKYRCEVNAIIFLSDGNINDNTFNSRAYKGNYNNAKWGFIDGADYNDKIKTFAGDSDGFWKKLETAGAPRLNNQGMQDIGGASPNFDKPPISYLNWIVPLGGFSQKVMNTYPHAHNPDVYTYLGWTYPHPPGGNLGAGFNYDQNYPIGNMLGPYGLAYMSYALSHKDLITENGLGAVNKGSRDDEGGLWDEEPYDKQTIDTYTIAFGEGIKNIPLAKLYLDYGSRFGNRHKQGYYEADDAKSLLEAINKIADKSVTKEAYSIGTPSVTPSADSAESQAIYSTIDTNNWSSQLRFSRMDKTGKIAKDSEGNVIFDRPSYANARLKEEANGTSSNRITLVNKEGTIYNLATDYHTILAEDGDDLTDTWGSRAYQRAGLAMWLLRVSDKTDSGINATHADVNLRERCIAKDIKKCNPNDASNPDRQMGDIAHMSIESIDDGIRKTKKRRSFVVTAANDGMVHIFKDTEQVQPTNSNSSYHPYELKLNYIPGSIPRENAKDTVLARIKDTAQPNYGKTETPHQSLINGGMKWMRTRAKTCTSSESGTATSVSTSQNCKRDQISQIFMSTTLGQGGKGVFTLNLGGYSFKDLLANKKVATGLSSPDTTMDTWKKSVPLWESGSEYPAIRASQDGSLDNTNDDNRKKIGLGYVMSEPVVGVTIYKRTQASPNGPWLRPDPSSKRYYTTFVANGYYSADQTPSLYVYNAMNFYTTEKPDGSIVYHDNKEDILIQKISVPLADVGIAIDKNGLSAPTPVDYDLDGIMDLVYAGDYNGNLYRFDLRAEDPSKWKASKIYAGSKDQPITAAPVIASLNPKLGKDSPIIVMFGTGSDIYDTDIDGPESKNIQSFYGIFDDPAKEIGTGDGKQPLVTYANKTTQLLQQDITITGAENNSITRYVSNKPITDKHQGWFIDLVYNNKQNGERVTTKADFTSKTVFFTSREYNAKLNNDKICTAITSSASGYNYGLNAKTGGSLTRQTDRFGHLKTQIDSLYFASAYQISGALSPPRIVSRKKNSSMMHGIEGRSGDELSDDDARNFAVDCIPGSNLYVSSSESGLSEGMTLICASNAAKRISWREIF